MTLLLKNPKKDLLLNAGFNVLHQESKEWLDTIAFWKYEINFFTELLNKKVNKTSDFSQLLKTLDKIHLELMDYLEKDIVAHEKYLGDLERLKDGFSEIAYREQHKKLSESMALFTEDIKEFKLMVFGYVKNL